MYNKTRAEVSRYENIKEGIECYICRNTNMNAVHTVLFPLYIRDEISKKYYLRYVCPHHLEDPEDSWV